MNGFIIENGKLTDYEGSEHEIVIPEGVEIIDNYVFAYNDEITSVVLPNSLRLLGTGAFLGCKSLVNITFGSGKLVVQQLAFAGCKALESIDVPGNVRTINYCMFRGCSSLRHVRLGDGVKNISVGAFKKCVSLKEVHLPPSIYLIRQYAFSKCTGLRKVVFDTQPRTISTLAFHKCSVKIDFQCNTGRFKDEMSKGFLMRRYTGPITWVVSYFGTSNEVEIPRIADVIGPGSFAHREIPFSVVVPGHLVNIGHSAFWCSAIEKIKISSAEAISKSAFWGCSGLRELILPEDLKNVGDDAFGACRHLKRLIFLSDNIEFEGRISPMCYSLEEISLPSQQKMIPALAFYYNERLRKINIPSTVEQIGNDAFVGCKSLANVYQHA